MPRDQQRPESEQRLHDFIIHQAKFRYSQSFKTVEINPGKEKNFEFQGTYPDIALGGYGHITMLVEVETKSSLTESKADKWRKMAQLGVPLTLMVPKQHQVRLTELLWKVGLMSKVKVATFEVVFSNL